ncbi:MAG: ISAs1 family transposase [Christensenellales bacterium]
MKYILMRLEEIQEPRQLGKIKHPLISILAMCIISVMCGARSTHQINMFVQYKEDWFRRFLDMPNGVPNRLTINRVLGLIKSAMFCVIFTQIMQDIQRLSKDAIVSLDGKSCFSRGEEGPLYMVTAWCNENSSILGQVEASVKSNEITAIPELLSLLGIQGLTVTIDAIGCQKKIVKQIVEKNKADYVIGLKRNQPNMLEELSLYAQDCLADPQMYDKYTHYQTIEKGHGRVEKRDYYLFPDLDWYEGKRGWENLNSVVMVQSVRQVLGQEASQETRYYISSLTAVEKAARAIRSHWGIENKLHWSLDVLMNEDDWMTKVATVASNLATIRKLALTFLRKAKQNEGQKLSGPMLMYKCSMSLPDLEQVLFGGPLDQALS